MSTLRVTASDFSVFGETNPNGSLKELSTAEAIENAFRMWLVSNRGEMIRTPGKGGYLKLHLSKPMTPDRLEVIRAAILAGLEQDFVPLLKVESLSIQPDYTKRLLKIDLKAISQDYKTKIVTTTTVQTG